MTGEPRWVLLRSACARASPSTALNDQEHIGSFILRDANGALVVATTVDETLDANSSECRYASLAAADGADWLTEAHAYCHSIRHRTKYLTIMYNAFFTTEAAEAVP